MDGRQVFKFWMLLNGFLIALDAAIFYKFIDICENSLRGVHYILLNILATLMRFLLHESLDKEYKDDQQKSKKKKN